MTKDQEQEVEKVAVPIPFLAEHGGSDWVFHLEAQRIQLIDHNTQ